MLLQVHPTGGRITVVQGSLPNIGPGAVTNREAGAGEKVTLVLTVLGLFSPIIITNPYDMTYLKSISLIPNCSNKC